jgi:trimethylamine---corrinoid protein Co-methyltransferase
MTRISSRAGMNIHSGFGLKTFTTDELKAVHNTSLQIIRDTGIKVEDKEAIELFLEAGSKVEKFENYAIVKIPPHIVEDALNKVPKAVTYYGRQKKDDVVVEENRVGFAAGMGEHVQVIDLKTRELRSTIKKDVAEITRIQDYLDVISVIERPACSGDCLPAAQSVHNYDAMVRNSSKHGFLGMGGRNNTRKIIEIGKIAVGGEKQFLERPIVTAGVCPSSPLTLVEECCGSIIESARGGIGIMAVPMSLSGASSPATPVGVILQHNIEVLSAIVLAQITNPGTPCTYGGCSTIMDLRFGVSPVGVPEMALFSIAVIKMAQFYQIPSWVGGGASDSKQPDVQQAYDFSLTAIPAAMAGANTIFGVGAIESILTFDYASMITAAEQVERILRVVAGIDTSVISEAADLIQEVGPGGNYISHKHTFQHMREMSQAKLFDRRSREAIENSGNSKDINEAAYDEAERIINTHQPLPLPDGAGEAIDGIIAEYEKQISEKAR